MKQIEELVSRLEKIANQNGDRFYYYVSVEATRVGISYEFLANEKSDGHCFVSGRGITIEIAIKNATDNIAASLVDWNYSEI